MGHVAVVAAVLAIHAAHALALALRYPDGHLFVDLRGARPADALDQLLRVLGVPGEQVPDDLAARAARYRSRLAGMRVVLVLDDAVALFTRTTGAARVAGEQADLVAEAVELCGRLPLAIRVAAARLRHRPRWTVASLVGRLRGRCLSELDSGSRGVAAAIGLSYVDLDDAHLLQQHHASRYQFHDLVRAHAAHRLYPFEVDGEPLAGGPGRRGPRGQLPRAGPAPAGGVGRRVRHALVLARAAGYVRGEHDRAVAHFGAALRLACVLGDRSRQVDALAGLRQARFGHGAPEQAVRPFTEALTLARAHRSRVAELNTLRGMGHVHLALREYRRAVDCFTDCVAAAREIGNRDGELEGLLGLGKAWCASTGRRRWPCSPRSASRRPRTRA